jgi:signal transduction histidine kinase
VVSRSSPALIGFRRHVKLFLLVLAAFFAAVVLLLIVVLQTNLGHMQELISIRDSAAADAAVADIRRIIQADADVDTQLLTLPARYGFAGVEVALNDGRTFSAGYRGQGLEPLERSAPFGTVQLYFDNAPFKSLQRRFWLTAAISLTATAIGLVLLFLYVPQILRPVEAMLADARELGDRSHDVDEASYLIETFRSSISTLKKQESELKVLHEREKTRADDLQTITSTLTRSLSSGLIALGPDDRLVELNAAARQILGVDPESNISGATLAAAVGDNAFSRTLTEAVSRREPLSRREIEIAGGSDPQIIGLSTVPLFSEAGRFLGTLALFTDLTEVRRLESRVRDMQTLADLGVMSAGIAHEFRNSLATILGYLKLASRLDPPADVAAKLDAAESEANQLADAVSRLLQFAGPMRLQPGEVDLHDLLEPLVSRMREQTPDVGFTLDGPPVVIPADTALLSRALENILRNAAEAASEREPGTGTVHIAIEEGERPAVIVRDNGAGISEADLANVFLPFFSTKSSGVGIGLPLARKIVLLHGGTLKIESRQGEGTVVRAELERGA